MNIKECHVILDQSQRRISYVHLCQNANVKYISTRKSPREIPHQRSYIVISGALCNAIEKILDKVFRFFNAYLVSLKLSYTFFKTEFSHANVCYIITEALLRFHPNIEEIFSD